MNRMIAGAAADAVRAGRRGPCATLKARNWVEAGMDAGRGAARRAGSGRWAGRALSGAFCTVGVAVALLVAAPGALAEPAQDPGNPPPIVDSSAAGDVPTADVPVPPSFPTPPPDAPPDAVGPAPDALALGPVAGQDPTPFTGTPPFVPPSFDPPAGATVGVAKPVVIDFARPIADRALAVSAVHISSTPPVAGHFYWMNNSEVRWRPTDFWPAHAVVNIDAAGTKSSFNIGDSLVATADDATHQMTVVRNGAVIKTIPIAMGKKGDETPNGTYYVIEKFPMIVMDSSTYGVPVDAPGGYKLNVYDATRISNTGIFVHAAPWSVGDQGKRDVSHGCINVSPDNAKWFIDNFNRGDPIVVKNSVGIYNQSDGYDDWQL
jgi:lipoprotein-anchoring transpeptidase ErfK/SrfK